MGSRRLAIYNAQLHRWPLALAGLSQRLLACSNGLVSPVVLVSRLLAGVSFLSWRQTSFVRTSRWPETEQAYQPSGDPQQGPKDQPTTHPATVAHTGQLSTDADGEHDWSGVGPAAALFVLLV